MKKKITLLLLLFGGTVFSGCIGNPKLELDTIGEIISEKDPVYDYMQGYVDNVSLVKEKDDGDNKTVWVKTTTEFDNFKYEGSYVIDCSVYSKDGSKEWDADNFQIEYEDIRFIPTQYDYTGTWMSENGEYCFFMNQFDWEKGKIGAVAEQDFSRDLIGYIDDSDNILHFGMKTQNSDELELDFNSEEYDENRIVMQAFDVYHFGEKCYHISNEQTAVPGVVYMDFASEYGYEYRDEDYYMANCLQLKTKDGDMVLNASSLLYGCGNQPVLVDGEARYQLDFAYNIEDYMQNFVGQELELYSFDTKLTTLSLTEDDVYPFFSYVYFESEKDRVEKAHCMANAVELYCEIFKVNY